MRNYSGIHNSSYNPFAALVLLGGILVLNLLYRAWRSRIHHGSYELSDDAGALTLKSDLGTFVFNKNGRSLEAVYIDNRIIKFGFDDIRNIEIITEDNEAMMQEFFLEGFSLFIDTNPKYRDVVQRYSITVVTKEFKRYPLLVMSQYLIKDFMNFAVDLQLDMLAMMNMYMPIDIYTQNIYEKFKGSLGKEFRFDRE